MVVVAVTGTAAGRAFGRAFGKAIVAVVVAVLIHQASGTARTLMWRRADCRRCMRQKRSYGSLFSSLYLGSNMETAIHN